MQECKLVKVPILVGVKLFADQCPKTQEEEEDMSHVPYASVVGSLMYAMVCTRPDIAHSVGVLSRYMSKPGKEHWTIVKRVFRYLCGTTDYGIFYQGRPRQIECWTYMDLLMQTRLEIWITKDLQVVMCLTYLEEKSVG
jgi:hypothetical protein